MGERIAFLPAPIGHKPRGWGGRREGRRRGGPAGESVLAVTDDNVLSLTPTDMLGEEGGKGGREGREKGREETGSSK
ncbi:hypothetical protein NSK_007190 [Nannochloropsis salina CCMP1776]|uniref:Uncharacterized protein n=1 Tax=Nannochloropsis salina CCMP1776 TaxID=1027361 RepID=A0A4D9CYE3_9STRA|nr:hypothetical protein NSK_007190 [Nannochloropsis salina CCMP1776]|eukprot:TFJ81468.1 hypothetical protein NSK_007190 [Nannochloropsis salina CCMP1776]